MQPPPPFADLALSAGAMGPKGAPSPAAAGVRKSRVECGARRSKDLEYGVHRGEEMKSEELEFPNPKDEENLKRPLSSKIMTSWLTTLPAPTSPPNLFFDAADNLGNSKKVLRS